MRVVAVILLLPMSCFAGPLVASTEPNFDVEVKSYREWKTIKISDVETKIRNIKEQLTSDPNMLPPIGKTEAGLNAALTDQLNRELLNLSNSKDLTISDYFVGYLSKQGSMDEAIQAVSGRLTADDVAELMRAYAAQFSSAQQLDSKSTYRFNSR